MDTLTNSHLEPVLEMKREFRNPKLLTPFMPMLEITLFLEIGYAIPRIYQVQILLPIQIYWSTEDIITSNTFQTFPQLHPLSCKYNNITIPNWSYYSVNKENALFKREAS